MKRLIVYFLEIIICYIIQSSMFHYMALANVMPNLLLILVVSTAYMRGRMTGLLIGLFSGLLVDLTFGSIIGLYGFIYMIIGYFMGFANKIYSDDDYTLPILFVAISDLVYGFLYYGFEFLLRGKLNFPYYLVRIILPEIVYTVVASILLYKLLHIVNNRLISVVTEEE
ncbi:MAG: rod shape-determining protein MreD [Clostridiales bacterium]|nr:rod shape-determining protein MreD [Clostridiales bacterium]